MSTRGAIVRSIVLLPPLGHDAALYAPLARAIGDRLEVVALDYPGFGEEPQGFDYEAPELLERLAGHFAQRIDSLGIEPVFLGGVSLGGTLSFPLGSRLARAPEGRLLLASGGLPVAMVRKDAVRTAMNELGAVGFARRHLGLDHPDLDASSLRTHIGRMTEDVARYFEHYFHTTWEGPAFEARANASVAMLRAALDVDFREAMRDPRPRSVVIWGDRDRIFSRSFVDRLVATLARPSLHVLDGVGHYPPLEAPDEVARIVVEALEGKAEA
ncbi:MAG: alpha/beta hydrolase [Polyangiales bacterium]